MSARPAASTVAVATPTRGKGMDDETQAAVWRDIARLRAETAALAEICALLLAEAALSDPAPRNRAAEMLARIQGRLEGVAGAIAAAGPASFEAGLAINEIIDHLSRRAIESIDDRLGPDAPRAGGRSRPHPG